MRSGVAHALSCRHTDLARLHGRQRPPSDADADSSANLYVDRAIVSFVWLGPRLLVQRWAPAPPMPIGTTLDAEVVPPAVLLSGWSDGKKCAGEAPHSPPGETAGVLERVKGSLAPLGGCAALDPPSALPVLGTYGECGRADCAGEKRGVRAPSQNRAPRPAQGFQGCWQSARSRLARRPRRAWLAASGRRNPGSASVKSGLSINSSICPAM